MSVLQCNRKDCENIMCDRYSHEFGYICDECFQELLKIKPPGSLSVYEFMNSQKENPIDWSEYYGRIFPNNNSLDKS